MNRLGKSVFLAVFFGPFLAQRFGVCAGEQMFQIRPESVEVRSGADVFLKCVVENQQGNAQWTKDGFALGFERHVPGYPRYSYSGDASKGEHHLIIKGVTLEDDGEYQCQVGPTMKTSAIWAAANVTVMVAPANVTLVGHEPGSTVEKVLGSNLQLQCLVTDARPAPSVAWYRDGHLLDQGLQEDRIKSSSHPRLLSVVSRLTVKVTKADDGQQYSCRALHPTLRDSRGSLFTSVTLSVLHPPGDPIITGYKTGEVLQAGDKRTLNCRVMGGNPRPWLTWYWHGWDTEGGKGKKTVPLTDKGSVRKGKKGKGVSVVHEITASRAEDGVVYECRVGSSQLKEPLSANVTMTVHYAPARVMVTGSSAVPAGKPFSLTCSTSPANPPATLVWLVDGKVVKGGKTEERRANGSGWITSSELIQYASKAKDARQVDVECKARHAAADNPINHNRLISITRVPGPPVVEVDVRGQVVAGTVLELTCTSTGGHPPPRIRLFKGEQEVEVQEQQKGNMTWARAAFKVVPADNGAKVRCEVSNAATTTPLTAHTTINLMFPAWEVITQCTPSSVEAREKVTLTCESSSSLPPSSLTWHSGGATLEGATTSHSPGLYGGTVTRSVLVVKPLADDNGRVFTCEADNGLGVTAAQNLTLDVLHGAMWVTVPSGVIKVNEGEDHVLTAHAAANPGPVTYTWREGTTDIMSEFSATGELRLLNVRRQQSGNYTVMARSPKGSVTAQFLLNVQYGPENVMATERVTVDSGDSASLVCSALGNPTPNITWVRPYGEANTRRNNSHGIMTTGLGEARLLVDWVSREDTGVYHCIASNVVSASKPVSSLIIVNQAPWSPAIRQKNTLYGEDNYWDSDYGHGQSWAPEGGQGRLECRVRAAPRPSFTWSTDTGQSIMTDTKYKISETKLIDGIVEWESVLEVKRVSQKDYINYTCTATNKEGLFSTILSLKPPATPDVPEHFTLVNVTSSSALFIWKRQTDERRPDGYTIKYWTSGARDYKFLNMSGTNISSAFIGGLSPGTDYYFTIQGYNAHGKSQFSSPPSLVMTQSGAAESAISSSTGNNMDDDANSKVPRLILFIMTLAGTALLALNMAIIACFVRRRSHMNNNRGVSASSSKTTTLEVFTPATTPGVNNQGEEVPLNDPIDFQHSMAQVKNEIQTNVGEGEFTKLFNAGTNGEHLLVALGNEDSPNNINATGSKGGRSLAQNGGLYLQKFRETGAAYYYRPLPQSNYAPGDNNVVGRLGNTPDVCPTDSSLLSPQSKQESEEMTSQLIPEGHGSNKPVVTSATHEAPHDANQANHHHKKTPSLEKHPQAQQQQQEPLQQQKHMQQQPQQSHIPQHQLQQLQMQHQHLQQQQQQHQKHQQLQRPHEWTPYDQIRAAGQDVSQLYHQQQVTGDQSAHRRLLQQIDGPDLYKFNEDVVTPLGYATVAPRRPRPLPNRFSTLQRPRPSASNNMTMAVGQMTSPNHGMSDCNHLSPNCPHNRQVQNPRQGHSGSPRRSHPPRHQLVRSFSENYALVNHAGGLIPGYNDPGLPEGQVLVPSDNLNPAAVPMTLANDATVMAIRRPQSAQQPPHNFHKGATQMVPNASSRDIFEGSTFN